MKTALIVTLLIMVLGFSGCAAADPLTGGLYVDVIEAQEGNITTLAVEDAAIETITAANITAENVTAQTLTLNSLPESDPGIPGTIWSDNGSLKVSK